MDIVVRHAFVLSHLFIVVFSYYVDIELTHNGPVVLGANITFTAKLINSLNQPPQGSFTYEWSDDASPQHNERVWGTKHTTVQWNVSYPATKYLAREYNVSVKVFIWEVLYFQVAHQSVLFNVTDTLNGKIEIVQEGLKDSNVFVSNAIPAKHSIKLSEPDHNFIANRATSVLTFWFVDCLYYGFSSDFSFTFNYTEEKSYNVEALVVASFDTLPLTTAAPTTAATTTTTISTTTFASTTLPSISTSATLPKQNSLPSVTPPSSTPSTVVTLNTVPIPSEIGSFSPLISATSDETNSTVHPVINDSNKLSDTAEDAFLSTIGFIPTSDRSIVSVLNRIISDQDEKVFLQKRYVQESANMVLNKTKNVNLINDISSFVCLNSSFVPPDPNKTYGYFKKQVTAKAPIMKVVVKGNNWLQFGDVLNLNISCKGSGRFQHCSKIKIGVHNVTGDETCTSALESDVCDFSLTHYFREANTYTYIIIISNDISKVVTPAAIVMYKVTVQPQLSVIVVPVTCSLLAIIIIVFGVAYYVQSQNRFTVEVADFDFGQANDMEYKSFYERLREEIGNLFSRSGEFLENTDVLTRRSKYDNMEES